ncbi:hypothetical protein LPY66_20195 [Dehalobacter sp. DCM]|uniref:hypothetical protein n=1 Tax=Dehalobacter sp. DCM TaxID=2907827 RepID=UPI0030818099|nr:hypothetical protein LPY66_20195 [Dehalobacter sp. DCM]
MGNAAGVRHYFIEAFTPYGYVSLLSELLKDIRYTYLLTGGPGTGKSTMMKLIGIQLIDRGYEVDYIRSIREPDSVAGIFLPSYRIALLDKNEFKWGFEFSGGYVREIDFTSFCRKSKLEEYRDQITVLEHQLADIEQQIIHQLREDYLGKQDNAIERESMAPILTGSEMNQSNKNLEDSGCFDEIAIILSKVKSSNLSLFFLHGLQLDSWFNLVPRYIKDFDRICLDSEESSDVMSILLEEVKSLGQRMDIIVHPLKPYTVIGLVFPEKNLAVWKGNPCRIEEQGFQLKHSPTLVEIMENSKIARFKLKNVINDTLNFRGLDNFRGELISSILSDLQN